MMNRTTVSLLLALVLLFSGIAPASVITYLELGTALGVNADYDSGTQTLTWSAGSSGWLGLDDGVNKLNFADVDIDATFSNPVGTPGNAISFTQGSFTITFNGYNTPEGKIVVAGNLVSGENYTEFVWDTTGGETGLLGTGLVDVSATVMVGGTPQTPAESGLAWFDGDSYLTNQTLLDTLFTNYGTQGYGTDNTIVQLWAEGSTWVPEPATMTLLGLGAVGLLTKRRKKTSHHSLSCT